MGETRENLVETQKTSVFLTKIIEILLRFFSLDFFKISAFPEKTTGSAKNLCAVWMITAGNIQNPAEESGKGGPLCPDPAGGGDVPAAAFAEISGPRSSFWPFWGLCFGGKSFILQPSICNAEGAAAPANTGKERMFS